MWGWIESTRATPFVGQGNRIWADAI